MNKFIKAIGREAGWYALVFSDIIIKFLPGKFTFILMRTIGRAVYFLLGYRRRIALNNLTWVFGKEKSSKEIRKIVKTIVNDLIRNHYELVSLYHGGNSGIREIVDIEGRENIDRALQKGRGVIMVSAHMGNFEIVCGRMTAEGYEYSAMAASSRDERAKKYFSRIWKKQGMDIIPSRPVFTALKRSVKALENNRILAIYADQNNALGGAFVDFFGRPAATATSPASLALRTGAPVIPVFIVRVGENKHRIIIEPPVDTGRRDGDKPVKRSSPEDWQAEIMEITLKINRIIEKYIRKYPEQWWWFHDRWKRKLKDSDKIG